MRSSITKKNLEFIYRVLPKLNLIVAKQKSHYYKLNKKFMPIKAELKIVNKYMDDVITSKELDLYNKEKQKLKKEYKENNYFTITEYSNENEDFYKSKSLYDYAYINWDFQKQSYITDSVKYQKEKTEEQIKQNANEIYGEKYDYFYMQGDWCRWVEEDRLKYGTIISIKSILIDEISEAVTKIIDKKYPTEIVIPKEGMFKPSSKKGYFELNMETKSNGQDEIIDYLKKQSYEYQNTYIDKINKILEEKFSKMCFVQEHKYKDGSHNTNLIYSTEISKSITPKNIIEDTKKYQQPYKIFKKELKSLKKEFKTDFVKFIDIKVKEYNAKK